MAEYLIQEETLTGIADEIRILSGEENEMTPSAMKGNLQGANSEVEDQEALISQISTALRGKALDLVVTLDVDDNGLITATAGDKTKTHQMAFQPAKTITPGTADQIAVSGAYYTGGDVVVAGDSSLVPENIKSGVSIFGVNGIAENADEVFDKVLNRGFTEVGHSTVTKIGDYAFCGCSNLSHISFPNAEIIGTSAFAYCSKIVSVYLPMASSVGNYAFGYCRMLDSVNFPEATSFAYGVLNYCSALTNVSLPKLRTLGNYTFAGCSNLTSLSFPMLTQILSSAFSGCRNLSSLTLGASLVCALNNSNAFNSTPYVGYSSYFSGTPYIFVPGNLLKSYRSAINWSYFSNYFAALNSWLGDISIARIQISTTANVSMEMGFLNNDEGLIPTVSVISEDDSVINISNVSATAESITFDMSSSNIVETVNITITATLADETLTKIVQVRVFDPSQIPEYTVEPLGTVYTFVLNQDEYYESNNKGADSSFAICKININANTDCTMHLDCINFAESNFDYGILSKLDSTLQLSNISDGNTNVHKTFKGESSPNIVTVSYEIPSGEHYIYVKFIKDGSGHHDNDSFQFKVRFE